MAPVRVIVPAAAVAVVEGSETGLSVLEDLADAVVKAHGKARSVNKRRAYRRALVHTERALRNVEQLRKAITTAEGIA